MDAHEHLRAQVAPPGSNLYYSLLFISPDRHRALCALAAWQEEARRLAFVPRDRSTALARIEWWREEVARLLAGAPRHPISIALTESVSGSMESAGVSMGRMVDGVRDLVARDRMMEEEELWQHCDALGSQGEKMIAAALATAPAPAPGVLEALGRGLEMLELGRPPPGERRITPRMVPLACDEALGGDPEPGARGHCSPAMRALLRGRVARGQRLLREAFDRLPELPAPPEPGRVVLARLALSQFRALARADCRRWDIGPSPFAKLWTAWRAARHLR